MSTQQPGWYPDPLDHADRRWFDGASWTSNVLDADGREGIDQLPGAVAPAATAQPGTIPPPPGAPTNDTWAGPAGAGNWSETTWQAPGASLPAVAPYTAVQPAVQPVVQHGGWPPQPARAAASANRRPNPIVIGLVAVAAALFVLSLFVLDWISSGPSSAGFGDLVADGATADAFLDKLSIWHFQWLGYAVVAAALVAVGAFVLGRVGSTRTGHVVAAIVAGVGALLATLAIVRFFRFPGLDPEFGAWLLPAGFVVLLAATVVSARTSSDG